MLNRTWPHILLGLFAFLSYLPSLSGDFILDDHPLVKDNPYIREVQGIGSYLSQEDGVSQVYQGTAVHTGYYRPLINLTYWLDYRLWGMSAPGFRATNLVWHILSGLALFQILFRFSTHRLAAFLGALLFVLHPVNTEAVSWISSRNNILAACWALLAFGLYVLWWEKEKLWALGLSTLCFGAALFSKEFGVMVLPLLFLYHRLLTRRPGNPKGEIAGYVPLAMMLLFYFWLRGTATGSLLSPGAESGGFLQRVYFAPYLVLLNTGLILFPHGLHSFIVGYPPAWLSWQAAAGFAFLCLCMAAFWRMRGRRMLSFGMAGFLLTLVPVLNIIPTSSVTLVSMRWLYFPMVFLVFALTDVLVLLLQKARPVAFGFSFAAAVFLGIYTWTLNTHLWHDEAGFFEQEVRRFQNLHYAGGLAEELQKRGQFEESEKYFRIAVSKHPRTAKNFINYSALLTDTGRPREALPLLEKAQRLPMSIRERAEWANNMGMAFFRMGNATEAIEHMREAVSLYPREPVFWSNLGAAQGSTGDLDGSEATFRKGLELAPHSELLRKNLALTYRKKGEEERARAVLGERP